jgi:Polysaccharide lyase
MRSFRSLSALLIALFALSALAPGAGAASHGKGRHAVRLADRVAVAKKKRRHRRTARANRSIPNPDGSLLFYGSKIGDFAMNQSAPDAVGEVSDPAGSGQSVLKMTVDNSDVAPVTPTSDPRAQLLSPSIINDGDEFWWSGEFFLPEDFPTSVPGWLTVMEGPYGRPFDGTPPWHIEVNGQHIQWQRNDSYDWDIPWQMPLVRNQWISVVVHERFANDGWVEMWVDGQQITFFDSNSFNPNEEAATTRLPMQTRDHSNDGGPNFTVIQSYRKADMFDSVSIFQGPMAIGTSKASVE